MKTSEKIEKLNFLQFSYTNRETLRIRFRIPLCTDQTWWVIILALSTVYISLVVIFAVLYFICEHMHFFIYQDGGLFPEACLAGVSEVLNGLNDSI